MATKDVPVIPGVSRAKVDNEAYEAELLRLQAELVKLQEWAKATGERAVIVFEGRDAAGKSSAVKRITQYLNSRQVRIAALPVPTERDRTQWYFQRYIAHLPAAGEIVLFDRSWYNRAGIEHVLGFCSDEEYRRFLNQTPIFERLLIEDGIILRKYWFSVSDVEQQRRFEARIEDPMRQWKLSPTDLQSITHWEDYSRAKDEMFLATDTDDSPWFVVDGENKKRSRINVISHLLSTIPYTEVGEKRIDLPPRPASQGYQRIDPNLERHVPDVSLALKKAKKKKSKKAKAKKAAKANAATSDGSNAEPPTP